MCVCMYVYVILFICLSVCVCVCARAGPSAITLKWHSIVNSQYITIQLYIRVDRYPLRYVAIEI